MSTPRGISLHVGVNIVDPDHYGGWEGPLSSCENDADTMRDIAKKQGFETHQLKTDKATRATVTKAIKDAASELAEGDFFLLTYSGHGNRIPDFDGDEDDGKDDTWCLYDGQLLDDEFRVLFAEFAKGVRVLMVSDSCHSGTMLRSVQQTPGETVQDDFTISRMMPRTAARDVSRRNRAFYQDIQRNLPNPRPPLKARIRLLSGCQESEQSFGNKVTGRFTAAVKKVFADGAFIDDYEHFHEQVVKEVSKAMNPQTPGHMVSGAADPEFDTQPPFKI